MRLLLCFVWLVLVAACVGPERGVELALEDATVAEASAALVAAGVPIAVSPDATLAADCARLTVRTPGPVPREEAARLVAHALEQSPLALRETPEGWVLELAEGARIPSSCAELFMMRLLGVGPDDWAPLVPPPLAAPEPARDDAPDTGLAPSADPEAVVAGIHRVSETEVEVSAAALDAMLTSPGLMDGASLVPSTVGGRVLGVRLFGVRSGGVLAALGLENGDTLRTVAGREVSSPELALDALVAVRSAVGPIAVELERGGRVLTIHYRAME